MLLSNVLKVHPHCTMWQFPFLSFLLLSSPLLPSPVCPSISISSMVLRIELSYILSPFCYFLRQSLAEKPKTEWVHILDPPWLSLPNAGNPDVCQWVQFSFWFCVSREVSIPPILVLWIENRVLFVLSNTLQWATELYTYLLKIYLETVFLLNCLNWPLVCDPPALVSWIAGICHYTCCISHFWRVILLDRVILLTVFLFQYLYYIISCPSGMWNLCWEILW